MSSPVMIERRWTPPRRLLLPARIATVLARGLTALPPSVIAAVLSRVAKGSARAIPEEVAEWRNAVNSVSKRCAGNGCLQRSVAVMLLGGVYRRAPVWCTGFRLEPFLAHAWVEVNGEPIGEAAAVRKYHRIITIQPNRGEKEEGEG